jgi:hypothetical protein
MITADLLEMVIEVCVKRPQRSSEAVIGPPFPRSVNGSLASCCVIGWACETERKFAGRGERTEVSGDGKERLVRDSIIEIFQNPL